MYYKFFKFSFIMYAFCAAQSVFGQAAAVPTSPTGGQSYTLEQAVAYAIDNNVSIKNAKTDISSAKGRVSEIFALGLPQINGTANLVHNFALQPSFFATSNPFLQSFGGGGGSGGGGLAPKYSDADVIVLPNLFQMKNSGNMDFTLNQLIFDGSYFIGLKAASTYKELSVRNLDASKITVAEQVSKAYYGVLVNDQRLGLLDQNINRLDTLFRQTRATFKAGFVEKIDVDRLEVGLNNLKTERQKAERMVELSRLLLKFQMGLPINTPMSLSDKLQNYQSLATSVQVDTAGYNYRSRIEYQTLQTQRTLANLDLKNTRSGYYPKLYGFATYGFLTQSPDFGGLFNFNRWFGYSLGGFSLQIPIFDGLGRHYKTQQAKLNIEKINNGEVQLQQSIDLQVRQASVMITNSLETLKTQKRNMELAQEIVRVSKVKYQQGVGSNIEVINAETSLREAQTNYFSALYDLLISKVDLDKATGRLAN